MVVVFQDRTYKKKTGVLRKGFYLNSYIKYYADNFLIKSVENDNDAITLITGLEGCQPKGSKVMMSNGEWKNIEDIKKGDFILSPQLDGSHVYSKVISTTQWFCNKMYDVYSLNRGNRKLYSCSYNHLIPIDLIRTVWTKPKHQERKQYHKKFNISAEKYNEFTKSVKKNTITYSCFQIDKFDGRQNCEIEPYCLGVYLGDGSFSDRNKICKKTLLTKGKLIISSHRSLNITSNDFEIIEEVSKYYPIMSISSKKNTTAKTYRFSMNGLFAKQLIKAGLNGKGSGSKFIPKEALYSDKEYRLRLLAGLIDTDGHNTRSNYELITKSERLAKDILFLIYSLGFRGSVKKCIKGIKKTGFKAEYYRINFYCGKTRLPVKCKRKQKSSSTFYIAPNRISIDLKESTPQQVYGFELDSPSKLYITDNYIVTHNSGKSTYVQAYAYYCQTMYSIRNKLKEKPFDDRNVVFTGEQLLKAIDDARVGQSIIVDEAILTMASEDHASSIQMLLIKKFTTIRKKRLFIFLVIPSIFMLRMYFAIFRTRAMINCYSPDGVIRGYLRFYSFKKKKLLFIRGKKEFDMSVVKPNFLGRFTDTYGYFIDPLKYEAKKDAAIKSLTADKKTKEALLKEQFEDAKLKLKIQIESWKQKFQERTEQKFAKYKNQYTEYKTKMKSEIEHLNTNVIKENKMKFEEKIKEVENEYARCLNFFYERERDYYLKLNTGNYTNSTFIKLLEENKISSFSSSKLKQILQSGSDLRKIMGSA